MANRWGNSGNKRETLFWGGSKITADGNWSHEIKKRLLLGRKVMTNLDSILKSRDITSPTKVHLVKAMVFPVVMCGCESWAIKKPQSDGLIPPFLYGEIFMFLSISFGLDCSWFVYDLVIWPMFTFRVLGRQMITRAS